MNILIIANGYPDKREPQWGCFEKDQALALTQLGHQVSILYFDRRFRMYWRKIGITKKRDQGLSIYGMFIMPLGWLRDKVSYELLHKFIIYIFNKLYKEYLKDNDKPDVIYAHYLWNISYATKLKEKYNIPLVGIEHWSGLTGEKLTPVAKYWGEIAYNKADRLLAVSKSLQTHIMRHFDKDSTVVYDMLGPEFVTTKVLKKGDNNGLKFIAVGSLLPIKNYDALINAFAKSGLTNQGCSLSIVGDGPERSVLEQIVKESKLENSVILHGRKTKQEIIKLFSESHVFALSSKAETFGVACIEALSQGLPAIATKCGGPEEIINDTNGILVEVGNEDAMSEAMCKMYDNYCQYDNVAIANECLGKFSPHVIASQLTEIFNEVTK